MEKVEREIATFAGGCFWCTEAVFTNIRGVEKVTPGYSGGTVANPSYKEVTSGTTGHAESLQIDFNPNQINYKDLLYIFFKTHNPTELNRQGPDVGTQYKSVIFYHSDKQKAVAEKVKADVQKQFGIPIVTEIVPYKNFYPAEAYHKQFYFKNPNTPYCRLIIDPKIQKLRKDFKGFMK